MSPTAARKLRIAVLLSGEGTSLENLCEQIEAGAVPAEVALVIASRPDAGGLRRAERRGIPAVAIPRRTFPDAHAFNDALHAELDQHDLDLVALLGFLSIFELRGRWEGRCINVHPSLIPAFCGPGMYGRRVHEAVLAAGADLSGATVHFADDHYDTGPVLLQEPVPVRADDTPDTLAARVQAAERRLLPEAIRLIAEGRVTILDRCVRIDRNGNAPAPNDGTS
jgi:formyltetrahydrofolate-dependent phosphoribosylglycinamide formyltransferase